MPLQALVKEGKMIRPNATRTLALNGLTITATISRDDETVFKRCGEKYSPDKVERFKVTTTNEEYEMKCKKRQEYYDMRNKEKSIENSKDSLDLMYEKKKGIGKSSSADFQVKDSTKYDLGTLRQKRRRDSSLDKIEHSDYLPKEFYHKPDGIPRSMSDILEMQRRKIKKWCELDGNKTSTRVSRKDNSCIALGTPNTNKRFSDENESSKRNFECYEYQTVVVSVKEDVRDWKKCRNGNGDKSFRNIRSRSATIPRKWSEHSLSTPSTTSGTYTTVPPPPIQL